MPKTRREEEIDASALREYRKLLGRRVEQLRRDRNMEVKALCDLLGWHKSEYSRKHRGLTAITDQDIVALRRVLQAPKHWPDASVEEGLLLEAVSSRAADVVRHWTEILAFLDQHKQAKH